MNKTLSRMSINLARVVGLALMLIIAAPSSGLAQGVGSNETWGAILAEDARAFHDLIEKDHPGAVDSENPEFRRTMSEGLSIALERATRVHDFGGYYWAMQAYAASFDDAHLTVRSTPTVPQLSWSWPGFLTAYQGTRQVIVTRDENDGYAPPIGAELVACDRTPSDDLAAERVGAFFGRWEMQSQQTKLGGQVFLDAGNPWVERPAVCRFAVGNKVQEHTLVWRNLSSEEAALRLAATRLQGEHKFSFAPISGGYWISMPSFSGAPSSDDALALTRLIEEAKAAQLALRAADLIVLDLRGNDGGSSSWGRELADILWGPDWMSAYAPPSPRSIDWRASQGNIDALNAYASEYRAGGDVEGADYFSEISGNLERARQANEPYWVQAIDSTRSGTAPDKSPLAGRVVVVTDSSCFSACLDTVDRWKAAGAIQVGTVTGADTVYIENRSGALASIFMVANLSMKVYRGRFRGNNVPQVPDQIFNGHMSDDAALLSWIRTIP